ncbi:MAG: RICIN domain-containing protein [Acidobacteriota bacterium]|nr:RICIN domain-containing protein [Acidobacteriota bacterium]
MKRLMLILAVVVGLSALALLPPVPTRKASARTVSIDTTKWYHIINRRSGKCLDMANANFTPGAHLIQYTCHNGANQKFHFTDMGSGYYRLDVAHSHQCVDQLNAVLTAGGLVGQYYCHNGYNQQVTANVDSNGYYQFNFRHSGLNMDVSNGSLSDGAQIMQYYPHGGDNQEFSIEVVDPCTDADGDTWCQGFDCNDSNANAFPGAPINCESGQDLDCDGVDDYTECYGDPGGGCCF